MTMKKNIWNNKTILVVEDDYSSQLLLKYGISDYCSNVIFTNKGDDVLDIVNSYDIDMILMDVKLKNSEMDGCELTRIIKSDNPDIKIIIQSAHALSKEVTQCKKSGCDYYMSKPLNIKFLLEKMNELFNENCCLA